MQTAVLSNTTMRFLKRTLFFCVGKIVFMNPGLLQKKTKNSLVAPFYHIVSDEDIIHVKHLYKYKNIKEFRCDLEFFRRNHTLVSIDDLLTSLQSEKSLPENSCLLSFDDGCRECYEVIMPILLEMDIPAVFFITYRFLDNIELFYRHKISILIEAFLQSADRSMEEIVKDIFHNEGIEYEGFKQTVLSIQYPQKYILDEIAPVLCIDFSEYLNKYKPYLSSNQVASLIEKGFGVGAHSMDHPKYREIPVTEQLYQTEESMKLIKQKFSLPYSIYAFPFSDIGVTDEYFQKVTNEKIVDISFGTRGLFYDDVYPHHIQRFILDEKPAQKTIRSTITRQIIRSFS